MLKSNTHTHTPPYHRPTNTLFLSPRLRYLGYVHDMTEFYAVAINIRHETVVRAFSCRLPAYVADANVNAISVHNDMLATNFRRAPTKRGVMLE